MLGSAVELEVSACLYVTVTCGCLFSCYTHSLVVEWWAFKSCRHMLGSAVKLEVSAYLYVTVTCDCLFSCYTHSLVVEWWAFESCRHMLGSAVELLSLCLSLERRQVVEHIIWCLDGQGSNAGSKA
ncbi:hypothetical protein ElyMa_004977600 [Elysia marginata]|uniref:SWIM-type domain-containing protein n=1 Tax=Elysia marginata TaxID=1093978 RepID=A0AAV4J5R2_9GAST|nr:hypothetical protein ElyMa_004977600 [Elysia marginata]